MFEDGHPLPRSLQIRIQKTMPLGEAVLSRHKGFFVEEIPLTLYGDV